MSVDTAVTTGEQPGTESAQVGLVRRYYELVDIDDVTGLVGLFAADAVYRRPGYDPIVGTAGLIAFYSGERVIRRGTHTLRKIVPNGPAVAVYGDFQGVLRDDREVRLRFADFFELDVDGRFTRRDTFFFAPMV
jgi:steroid delta-isomerase